MNFMEKLTRRLSRTVFRLPRKEPPKLDYIRFVGDYGNWEDARKNSQGYDSEGIAERVLQTTQGVLKGEFAFERDSVGFRSPQYSWQLLACLLHCAARNSGRLRVIDFGGSMGSVFFQHRSFLKKLSLLDWRVVEQPAFVRRGRESVSEHPLAAGLSFHDSLEGAMQPEAPEVLLLSSVLQYLQEPLAVLSQMLRHRFPYVILDRTAVLVGEERCLLSVQHVPTTIYAATYPAWFLSELRLECCLSAEYDCLATWQVDEHYTAARGNVRYIGKCLCLKAEAVS